MAAATPTPSWCVELVATAPSTNALAVERARSGADEGLVVVADHQAAGRGRLGRTWVTPPRSALTLSVLLRPDDVPAARWSWLPLLAGLAVAEGVRRGGGPDCALKWPNDLLVEGRKVAGILVERVETPRGAAAVVGVGLNVSQTAEELPVPTATSLLLVTGHEPDRAALLGQVLAALHGLHHEWRAGLGDPLRARASYREACDTLGRAVAVHLPDGSTLRGTARDVDDEGRLVVVDTQGRATSVGAGDVVHVRPASESP